MANFRQNHPGYYREYMRKRHLQFEYGITPQAFSDLLEGQGGVCAICGTSEWNGVGNKPHVDHDHETGNIRGLLCGNCNHALGFIRDNPAIALAMAEYLKKSK